MPSASHANLKSKQTTARQPMSGQATLGMKGQHALPTQVPGRADGSRRRHLQVESQGFILVRKEKGSAAPKQHKRSTSAPSLIAQNKQQQQRTHSRSKQSGRKGDADRRDNWSETVQDDLTNGLNWQQASLLKSKRAVKKADLPTWAPISVSTIKRDKRRSKTGQASTTLLPPLRFSSEPGKAAWRFVLPSPRPPHTDDLPKWCGPKTNNLIVTLSSRRSSTSPSATSSSSDSDSSVNSSDEESELDQKTCTDDLVSGMLQSLSIYAGPSFSAAAPQPCHLPFPSFLTRS